ncbi:hypothetical protein [Jeotgalibacillus soli]|uniref:Uncharacterized protein n=1 Tax=Jeotgalibacillus soli TaxID=889306 RepID=A0A0C2VQS9_9BACL|nr:hypothetical protein [Jeotgalibacillus soli]KIL46806.1 hypothetical protein KP78_19240 [Jeotgalibacillus soli]
MELKYKGKALWKITGIVWLLVALLNLGLMLFLFNGFFGGFELLLTPLL